MRQIFIKQSNTNFFEYHFGCSEVSSRMQTDRQSDGRIVFSRR